jgi:predicted nucleic acid-binding protein
MPAPSRAVRAICHPARDFRGNEMNAIADTGFIVAFARENDQHHAWAVDIAGQVSAPLLTCEAVLAEASFHLQSSPYVLSLLEDGLLRLAFDCNRHLEKLTELARRYEDRHPDLADLCLIRMSELYPKHPVISVDEADFRIYRRNKREAIPTICPPK